MKSVDRSIAETVLGSVVLLISIKANVAPDLAFRSYLYDYYEYY